MSAELHLPDLPEVPLTVGTDRNAPRRRRLANGLWLRDTLTTSLPLILMALLAAGTWYLSRLSPRAPTPSGPAAVRHDPDYTMRRFTLQRFDEQGRLSVQLEGERLRHFPDTDEIEIDTVHVRATDEQGREVLATARQARVSADGNQVTLEGGAQVRSLAPGMAPAEIHGEHLVAYIREQRVVANRPVQVRQGHSEFNARAVNYDGRTRVLTLQGPARVVLNPATPARR